MGPRFPLVQRRHGLSAKMSTNVRVLNWTEFNKRTTASKGSSALQLKQVGWPFADKCPRKAPASRQRGSWAKPYAEVCMLFPHPETRSISLRCSSEHVVWNFLLPSFYQISTKKSVSSNIVWKYTAMSTLPLLHKFLLLYTDYIFQS